MQEDSNKNTNCYFCQEGNSVEDIVIGDQPEDLDIESIKENSETVEVCNKHRKDLADKVGDEDIARPEDAEDKEFTPNPNKANQHKPDPRQSKFLSLYLNPDSDTFGNAKQSGIKAGYSESYARNLTNLLPSWISDSIDQSDMVKKAEKNLNELLDVDIKDASWARIKKDVSEFVLERLNKEKYSKRTEHTGKDGGAIELTDERLEEINDKLDDVV